MVHCSPCIVTILCQGGELLQEAVSSMAGHLVKDSILFLEQHIWVIELTYLSIGHHLQMKSFIALLHYSNYQTTNHEFASILPFSKTMKWIKWQFVWFNSKRYLRHHNNHIHWCIRFVVVVVVADGSNRSSDRVYSDSMHYHCLCHQFILSAMSNQNEMSLHSLQFPGRPCDSESYCIFTKHGWLSIQPRICALVYSHYKHTHVDDCEPICFWHRTYIATSIFSFIPHEMWQSHCIASRRWNTVHNFVSVINTSTPMENNVSSFVLVISSNVCHEEQLMGNRSNT